MVPSIMASRPGPEAVKQPQTITLPPRLTPDVNGTHTFQKVQLLSHQSTEYLPKSLGDNQDIFCQM